MADTVIFAINVIVVVVGKGTRILWAKMTLLELKGGQQVCFAAAFQI